MHPFVALMRRYCIDYTNSHDQSLYDEIMEPDYVVHINGIDLGRVDDLRPSVETLFAMAPGPRPRRARASCSTATGSACASASTPRCPDRRRARAGVLARHRPLQVERHPTDRELRRAGLPRRCTAQLATGEPHPLDPPHLDPWAATEAGRRRARRRGARPGVARPLATSPTPAAVDDRRQPHRRDLRADDRRRVGHVNDLFSAGPACRSTSRCTAPTAAGSTASPGRPGRVAGVAHRRRHRRRVADGSVDQLDAVTGRMQLTSELTGVDAVAVTGRVMDTRPDVDLLDPRFHVGDPHPAYRWMRENEPLYRDRNGIWCVTRMEHVRDDRAAREGLHRRAGATGRSGRRPRRR